jgi:hypothetical protein
MDDLPVIHLCLFGCGLVVNSAPTRQSGLVPHTGESSSIADTRQFVNFSEMDYSRVTVTTRSQRGSDESSSSR